MMMLFTISEEMAHMWNDLETVELVTLEGMYLYLTNHCVCNSECAASILVDHQNFHLIFHARCLLYLN